MRGVALHKALAVRIAQNRAFASAAFGQQHARTCHAGGVELPELHVFQGDASTRCHAQAVARVDKCIGGRGKYAPGAARGQQCGFRLQNVYVAGFHFQRRDTDNRAFGITHQVHGQPFHKKAGAGLHVLLVQRVQHGVAGAVGGSTGALYGFFAVVGGVAAKGPLVNRAVRIAVERHTHVFQVIDHFWGFAAHELDGVLVAQPVRAFDGIVKMVVPVVLVHIAQRGTDTALRRHRMRARGKYFGKHCDVQSSARQLQ